VEAIVGGMPPEFALKGMFFARYIDGLRRESGGSAAADPWPALAKKLASPPAQGRYHAFESYPMRDYIRVFDCAARARFPGSTREAYRLLSRGEVEVFAESTLGKVTFSMLKDPEAALLRYPELFGMLSKGPVVTAERAGARRVDVKFHHHVGSPEHLIGVLEGLAMTFDVDPELEVDVEEHRAEFRVRW
jgi:uncharacterized protein (TIGR02265 family)